jgi:hypothetical protein
MCCCLPSLVRVLLATMLRALHTRAPAGVRTRAGVRARAGAVAGARVGACCSPTSSAATAHVGAVPLQHTTSRRPLQHTTSRWPLRPWPSTSSSTRVCLSPRLSLCVYECTVHVVARARAHTHIRTTGTMQFYSCTPEYTPQCRQRMQPLRPTWHRPDLQASFPSAHLSVPTSTQISRGRSVSTSCCAVSLAPCGGGGGGGGRCCHHPPPSDASSAVVSDLAAAVASQYFSLTRTDATT